MATTTKFIQQSRFVLGSHGKSLSFNGTSDYATIPGFYPSPNSWSLSYRIYKNRTQGLNTDRIFDCQDTGNANGFIVKQDTGNSGLTHAIYNSTSADAVLGIITTTSGRWQHIVLTYQVNSAKLYHNNFNQSTDTGITMTPNSSVFTIGAAVGGGSNWANFLLSDFMFWQNKVLTVQEVDDLYYGRSIPSGCTIRYDFNDNTTDKTGNGFDMVLNSGTSYSTNTFFKARTQTTNRFSIRNFGYSIGLNGSTSYISVAQTSGLPCTPSQQWSLSFWCKLNNLTGGARIFSQGSNAALFPNFDVFVSDTSAGTIRKVKLWVRNGGAVQQKLADTSLDGLRAGEWQHHVMTNNNGTVTYYINGVEISGGNISYTPSGVYNFNRFIFGAAGWTPVVGNINASYDEIVVYKNYTLSATEVDTIYRKGVFPTATKTLYLTFPEGSGTTSADQSGLGNTATLTDPTWSNTDVPFGNVSRLPLTSLF